MQRSTSLSPNRWSIEIVACNWVHWVWLWRHEHASQVVLVVSANVTCLYTLRWRALMLWKCLDDEGDKNAKFTMLKHPSHRKYTYAYTYRHKHCFNYQYRNKHPKKKERWAAYGCHQADAEKGIHAHMKHEWILMFQHSWELRFLPFYRFVSLMTTTIQIYWDIPAASENEEEKQRIPNRKPTKTAQQALLSKQKKTNRKKERMVVSPMGRIYCTYINTLAGSYKPMQINYSWFHTI